MAAINFSAYSIANAGIYLTNNKTGILIDGLFDPYEGFDALPASAETSIFQKQTPFEQLSALIFTHSHPDHYSPKKVDAFLNRYPQTPVCFPEKPFFSPSFEEGNDSPVLFPIPCRHLLDNVKPVPHMAFFLKYGGKTIFVSGDSDPVSLNKQILNEQTASFPSHTDLAFINPFFLFLTPGRHFLKRLMPSQIYVYHMPLLAEDTMHYHEVLKRGLQKSTTLPIHRISGFMEPLL